MKLAEIWFSGGRNHATVGELATHGVLIDDVTFTVIPEPASIGLLAIGALALLFRRKK